jgi:hypothetical protein
MALTEFLHNLQTARNIVLSQLLPPDLQRLDYRRLKRAAPMWLSPRVIAGADPLEFTFLEDDQSESLNAVIKEFLKIADALVDREPTLNEVKRGSDCILSMAKIIGEPILDAEGVSILMSLLTTIHSKKKVLPEFVLGIDYSLDSDWSGDPGIWLWLIVPDDIDVESKEYSEFSDWFRMLVWDAVTKLKSERIPYTRLRLVSEVTESMSEGVA